MKKPRQQEIAALEDLIARGREDRDRQIALLHKLTACGQSTAETLSVLGEIEDSLAGLRSRRAYLRTLPVPPDGSAHPICCSRLRCLPTCDRIVGLVKVVQAATVVPPTTFTPLT